MSYRQLEKSRMIWFVVMRAPAIYRSALLLDDHPRDINFTALRSVSALYSWWNANAKGKAGKGPFTLKLPFKPRVHITDTWISDKKMQAILGLHYIPLKSF